MKTSKAMVTAQTQRIKSMLGFTSIDFMVVHGNGFVCVAFNFFSFFFNPSGILILVYYIFTFILRN